MIIYISDKFEGGLPLKISKRSTQWANFLVGFGGPRPSGARVAATPIFPPKVAQKLKN